MTMIYPSQSSNISEGAGGGGGGGGGIIFFLWKLKLNALQGKI